MINRTPKIRTSFNGIVMKHFVATIVLFASVCLLGVNSAENLKCTIGPADIPTEWKDMVDPCIEILRDQVQTEIKASLAYLAMGAHFARDTVNRPGFSELFFKSASEEREHGIKIIEYLLMRGQLTKDVSKLLQFPLEGEREAWNGGLEALNNAIELETKVTSKLRKIIDVCESPKGHLYNDYHLSDWLTGEFLDEQYKGERDLAGKISTLGKIVAVHGAFGEFLFDKKLLNKEI